MPNPVIIRRLYGAAPVFALPQLPNLILKLESVDFDKTPNATQITLWSDHSGVGNNFNLTGVGLLGNPTNPKVDGSSLCNGHHTVRFSGADGIGNSNSMSFASSPGVEMMCVFKDDSATPGAGDYFFQLMRPGNGTQELQPFADGNFYECFGRTDRPSLGHPASTSITSFFCYDVVSKSDGSLYSAWANKENFFSVTSGYTYAHTQGATQTTIGCAYTGVTNVFATGNVAACYVWKTALSTAERAQARAYINNLWGISFA